MTTSARLLLVPLLAGLALGAGCTGETSTAAPQRPASPAAAKRSTVTVARVEARDAQRTVETTGSLLAWEEVTLNTRVAGTVERLHVDLGDRVGAGQVVAELDRREFELGVRQAEAAVRAARDAHARARAEVDASRAMLHQVRASRRSWEAGVARAKAALDEARLNLERTRKLVDDQLVARRDLDAARTHYETALAQHETAQVELGQYPERVRVAEAQLRSALSTVEVAESEIRRRDAELGLAQKKLVDATLRTPIRGAVARRYVNPGEALRESAPVFTIVRSDVLKYSGTVPEYAALAIRPGQVVHLLADATSGRPFTGRVTRVSPAVDVATRTVLLEAQVPNADGTLKPGLFARGVADVRRERAVFVPESAVSYFAGITKVFVIADGKAEEREVKLGPRRDGAVEVVEGVKGGEVVATSGLGQLYHSAPVAIAEPMRR